ncbi:MAG: hypothetical protein IPG70_15565 [Moraxellaceae bacterium]|nr:hypothetical protein [Moraxellaceae bacterium]
MTSKVASDMGEAQTDYNDSSWIKWTGEPQPQELKGVIWWSLMVSHRTQF